MIKRKINCCNPGYNASCALCCGSHNFNVSYHDIHHFLEKKSSNYRQLILSQTEPAKILSALKNSSIEKKDPQAIQCPFMGYLENNTLGCLVYDTSHLYGSEHENFFRGTCKTFFCPAWEKLSDDEISMAAQITADWFYYTLLIHDIDELQMAYKNYLSNNLKIKDITELKKRLLKKFDTSG